MFHHTKLVNIGVSHCGRFHNNGAFVFDIVKRQLLQVVLQLILKVHAFASIKESHLVGFPLDDSLKQQFDFRHCHRGWDLLGHRLEPGAVRVFDDEGQETGGQRPVLNLELLPGGVPVVEAFQPHVAGVIGLELGHEDWVVFAI